jgi:hypothetical protein
MLSFFSVHERLLILSYSSSNNKHVLAVKNSFGYSEKLRFCSYSPIEAKVVLDESAELRRVSTTDNVTAVAMTAVPIMLPAMISGS